MFSTSLVYHTAAAWMLFERGITARFLSVIANMVKLFLSIQQKLAIKLSLISKVLRCFYVEKPCFTCFLTHIFKSEMS